MSAAAVNKLAEAQTLIVGMTAVLETAGSAFEQVEGCDEADILGRVIRYPGDAARGVQVIARILPMLGLVSRRAEALLDEVAMDLDDDCRAKGSA